MLESSKGIQGKWAEWAASPRKSFWVMLVLVILTSLAFMSLLPASTWYERLGIDTYHYIGLGNTYPERWFRPSNYKISRLPWVLFLSIYYHFINSDYAIPVLAVSRTLAQGILAYTVAWRFTRNLASSSLVAFFVSTSSLWGIVGGWNYHAVPGGILLWSAIAFLPLKMAEVSLKRYMLSFGAFSLALHAHSHLCLTTPAFIVLCLIPMFDEAVMSMGKKEIWKYRKVFLLRIVSYAFGIFAIITAILAGIHKIFYGTGAFWKNNLKAGVGILRNEELVAQYRVPWSWSLLEEPYVVFLLCAILCALFILLAVKRCAKPERIRVGLVSCSFLLALFIFSLYELSGGFLLDSHYQSFLLCSYGMSVLAVFIDMLLSFWRSSLGVSVILTLAGTLLFIVAASGRVLHSMYPVIMVAVLIFVLWCISQRSGMRRIKAMLVALLLCSMLFRNGQAFSRVDPVRIASNRTMLRHLRFILALNEKEVLKGREDKPLHWNFSIAYIEDDEFSRGMFAVPAYRMAVSFTAMAGLRYLGGERNSFGLAADKKYDVIHNEGMRVVVLGSSRDLDAEIEKGLRNLGLEPELQHVRMETSNGVDVYMWIYAVEKR